MDGKGPRCKASSSGRLQVMCSQLHRVARVSRVQRILYRHVLRAMRYKSPVVHHSAQAHARHFVNVG